MRNSPYAHQGRSMQKTTPIQIGPDDAVDLHMHTLASDGRWTPETLTAYLVENDFKVVALADHDTMASVPEMEERCSAAGIHLVHAVEMTTRWQERHVHCLVYGIDLHDRAAGAFEALMHRQQENLRETAERMVSLLERHGRHLPSLDEVTAGRPLWPHLVFRTMIKDGHGNSLFSAHNIIRGLGEPALVDVPLAETVDAAHEAGAVAIIAHPGRDDGWGFLYEDRLDTMRAEIPIDGVEAHYRSYTSADTERYRAYAELHGLLVSSGSDSHWPNFPVNPTPHPARWTAPLLARLGIEVGPFEGPAWVPPPEPPEDSAAG
jgi:3',5'-nucleoside bisphosphate phosphatase